MSNVMFSLCWCGFMSAVTSLVCWDWVMLCVGLCFLAAGGLLDEMGY